MGDRGHVYVHDGDRPGVYLYAHSAGSELPELVADGLEVGQGRWSDMPYLTRIIFDEVIKGGGGVSNLLGFGIDTRENDIGDGHRVVDVDTAEQAVTLWRHDQATWTGLFERFVSVRPGWDELVSH